MKTDSSYFNSPTYKLMQKFDIFKTVEDQYSFDETMFILNDFEKQLNEIKPTPLPEIKALELSPAQREKMLLETRKQINRELKQVRNQIKRNK